MQQDGYEEQESRYDRDLAGIISRGHIVRVLQTRAELDI